jgi:hypothetical protein
VTGRFLLMFSLCAPAAVFGATWSETNSGLRGAVPGIEALTVDPTRPSTIYARTTEKAIFKVTDGAGSWRPLISIAGVSFLVVDPKTSSTLYASTSRGMVLKSTNVGESWIAWADLVYRRRGPADGVNGFEKEWSDRKLTGGSVLVRMSE